MSGFTCPVCGGKLASDGKMMNCASGHSYNIARSGYVNLLMSNAAGGKRHGDDRLMINARHAFLNKGYYQPLLDGIYKMILPRLRQEACILDCGCGEGWYTSKIYENLAEGGILANMLGVDISRDALKIAARSCGDAAFAVASAYRLPVADSSCDCLLSIFSPLAEEEYARVLAAGGYLLRAVPLEEHLIELKKAVYDVPRLNPPDTEKPKGFVLADSCDIRYSFSLDSNEDIMNLFYMTPYYYKSGESDQLKLKSIDNMEISAAFGVRLWERK